MKFIIVEGANGVGKSTFVNKLKDQLPNCGILKLTGLPGDSHTTYIKSRAYHDAVLNFLISIKDLPGHMILDRCYFSEVVMATLYKDWDFKDEAKYYTDFIRISGLDINFIFLWCNPDTFVERLNRNKVEFNSIPYESRKSIEQQEIYRDIFEMLPYDLEAIWLKNEGGVAEVVNYALNSILTDNNY